MIYDISPTISEKLAVWPGDHALKREVSCDIDRGDNVTLSSLHATVHLGAHADAPNHYRAGGEHIAARSLEYYLGTCQVVQVSVAANTRVTKEDISVEIAAERILLRTDSYSNPEEFSTNFAAYDPQLIALLHTEYNVRTVGIDTPSIDLFDSQELPSHQCVADCDMAILEGLVLQQVPPGVYQLIALPLKLAGFDASPLRAVLQEMS